jgi:hypothetical protein
MKKLNATETKELLAILEDRFEKNIHRHESIKWNAIRKKLEENPSLLFSVSEMEQTEGEPDVVVFGGKSGKPFYVDCSPETPKGRRSFCYDRKALDARKENKPKSCATDEAKAMGIQILNEEQYRHLQTFGPLDTKTSSWLLTPESIRSLGGAIFGDYRYGQVFIYHNGADSYYAVRGFRGMVAI